MAVACVPSRSALLSNIIQCVVKYAKLYFFFIQSRKPYNPSHSGTFLIIILSSLGTMYVSVVRLCKYILLPSPSSRLGL